MRESVCAKPEWSGRCCCNCKHHIEDFDHCTTVPQKPVAGCCCSVHKGWICMPPEFGRAHSDWPEHGMCEMHEHDTKIVDELLREAEGG